MVRSSASFASLLVSLFFSLFVSSFLGSFAQAQSYPDKPIRMYVGYAAGSGIDATARFFAERIREGGGQPVLVENRPGALGNIAATAVARAAPDGYSILFTPNSTHAANIHLFKKLPFDPVKDFTPVTTVVGLGFILLVNPAVMPAKNVAELTALLRSQPGKYSYGSGNATGRIAAELYKNIVGFDAVHVPYKAVPQAVTELLGGQIHFIFADATFGLPQARSGKVRGLAVTTARRWSFAPEIPTMMEAGVPEYDLISWFAVFMPANAPREVVQKLSDILNAAAKTEATREFLAKIGAEPFPGSPEFLGRFAASETEKWGRIIKAAGIEPE